MRKLLLLVLATTALAACDPAGYYVSKVYSANGQLLQERCEITFNHRPDPTACHVEPVTADAPPQQPGYPPPPPGYAPPQPPQPPPGYGPQPPQPQPQPQPTAIPQPARPPGY